MKRFRRLLPELLLSAAFFSSSLFAAPPKAPPKPAGPDKNSIEYKLDKAFINGFYVESCPASQAVKLLSGKKLGALKVAVTLRVRPDQDRSVTWDLKKKTSLRAALNQLNKYGYIWRKNGRAVLITPVGKATEWKTGYGSLKIIDGDPAWLNRMRVRNAKFINAPFSDIEKLLRNQKYKIAGVGRTPVKVTLAAGNVSLKQFLSAVCMATGFDCEVNKQQIRFRKGAGIGYYPLDMKLKRSMVKYKYPKVNKAQSTGEFIQKAPGNTAWVFLHVPGINMAYYRAVVPANITGNTMSDTVALLEKVQDLNVHYVANGVAILIPSPGKAQAAFARRLKMNLTDLKFVNAPLKKVLDEITRQSYVKDPDGQGLPIVFALKTLPTEKISMDIPEIQAGEFLRRITLALGGYGYISRCGTSYILVKSGLFGFKGITINKQNPMTLQVIPAGADCVDVPLDFESIDFQNVTVENVLKFVKVLSFVRFGDGKLSVRWGIPRQETLRTMVRFKVEQPTIRAILDALSVRSRLSVDFQMKEIYVKQDY